MSLKRKHTTVRFTDEEHEAVRRLAKKLDRSIGWIIRQAVKTAVKTYEREIELIEIQKKLRNHDQ